MNICSMAIKNLKKNFTFYLLYLLSVSFVLTIFFAFTSFSMNAVMLKKISTDGRVETMCNVISVFLMAFVIFYMAYSNRFFLHLRIKELGIYTLLGYRKATVLQLLILENIIVCTGALIIGIVFGGLLHKGIVATITTLLKLSIDNTRIPFFNNNAIIKTTGFVMIVVIVLCLSNVKVLLRTSLLNLVRMKKSSEVKIIAKKFPALLGVGLILSGYTLSLNILSGTNSLWSTIGFSPIALLTMVLVITGTVLFIASFLPYAMERSKRRKQVFYTETKIITTPNFIFRIRSNAKTLIMLTLLSAATLTITSVMALTLYYPIAAVSRIAPSEFEFRITHQKQASDAEKIIHQYTTNNDIVFTKTAILKVQSSTEILPMEYSIGSANGEGKFECISQTAYKTLMKAQKRMPEIKHFEPLNDGECILIKYQPTRDGSNETGNTYDLEVGGNTTSLVVKETTLSNPISFANSIGTLVVSDNIYHHFQQLGASLTEVLSINGKSIKNNETLYSDLNNMLDGSAYLQGHSHRINELISINSSTLLLIGFLVVLFFIATGSILYFNNISVVANAREDYVILRKMGYTEKKIKIIIINQVLTFFGIPFILGLLDCLFSIIVYKYALMQNLLGNAFVQYIPVMIAVGATAVIYIIYYLLTLHTCFKIVTNE